MQSNNPVFRRSEEFSRAGATHQGYGQAPYQGDPGMPGADGPITHTAPEPMTIDTVVQKSAMTLGLVLVTAFVTWVVTPNVEAGADLGMLYLAAMGGAGLAFVLSLVNSFKREISPALVLAFAAAEGVALGGISKVFQAFAGDSPIVVHAVLGTFGAFAGTLAVYKFFNIQVGDKFRTMVTAAMFGMVGLGLMEMVLGMFNSDLGLFGMGTLGLLFAVAGLVLGVFMLVMDFDFIERGVANGIDERQSWRAAFALTVSLVWIYTNLLRILAIMNQD